MSQCTQLLIILRLTKKEKSIHVIEILMNILKPEGIIIYSNHVIHFSSTSRYNVKVMANIL